MVDSKKKSRSVNFSPTGQPARQSETTNHTHKLLYDGPAELNEYGDHWSADLPTGVGVRAWGGTEVRVKIWEADSG